MKLIKRLGTRLRSGHKQSYGLFLCPYCEEETEKQLSAGKNYKSCGCNRSKNISESIKGNKNPNYKHGKHDTRIYRIWNNIINRCYNSNHKDYKHYGERGIEICEKCKNNFMAFYYWTMENGYNDDLEINRIDNNGNYEPDNCNFITHKENCRNRRDTLPLETRKEIRQLYATGDYIYKELAEEYGVSQKTISNIVNEEN